MRRSLLLPLALAAALAACGPKLSQQDMVVEEGAIKEQITLWEQSLNSVKPDSMALDRKSTRLNSSHQLISYDVFCLKKKKRLNKVLVEGTAWRRGATVTARDRSH